MFSKFSICVISPVNSGTFSGKAQRLVRPAAGPLAIIYSFSSSTVPEIFQKMRISISKIENFYMFNAAIIYHNDELTSSFS